MSDALRVMPETLEIDQRVIRSLDSGGFASPLTRRQKRGAWLASATATETKRRHEVSWSYRGPNESIKVGQVKLTNTLAPQQTREASRDSSLEMADQSPVLAQKQEMRRSVALAR